MKPEQWQQIRALFELALDQPKSLRLEFVERIAAEQVTDPLVLAEVRAMLAADQTMQQDASPLVEAAPDLLQQWDADARKRLREALIGTRLGPWQLTRELGHGGMGAVYLGVRAEGDFEQRGAVKLIRPGWEPGEIQQRFRAERRILAALNHPHIARLLDGGETADGKPYLVMEYVDGQPVDAYCDAHRLDIEQRLRLLQSVCTAVAHAHQHLVVHRDLKPSNILIDSSGQAKLLDFGIAKLLEPSVRQTGPGTRVFTPEYAAPEQVRGEPVTTGVDVYALGLLLFELLTGRRPYQATGSTPAAYEHAILTQEPARPSTVVAGDDDQSAALAWARDLNPNQLGASLRGDLDAIVLKALRKDPQARYASVEALSEDIECYLQRRPVQARRGNWRYRAQRFVQRHALAVGLSLVALSGLGLGLGLALWQADVARHERDLARREALTTRRALEFLQGLFQLANPSESLGKTVTAVDLLAKGSREIRDQLVDEPAVRTRLLIALGDAHLGLGVAEPALPLLQVALADARRLNDPMLIGTAMASLGAAMTRQGDDLGDEALMREALALPIPADADGESLRGRLEYRLAIRLLDRSEYPESEVLFRQGVARIQAVNGTLDPEMVVPFSSLLNATGRAAEAERLLRDALVQVRALRPVGHPSRAGLSAQLALNLTRQGRAVEAEPLLREALIAKIAIYGPDHSSVDITRQNLAKILSDLGRWKESEVLNREVLARFEQSLGADHPSVAASQASLARTLIDSGRPVESEPYWRAALATATARFGERDAAVGIVTLGLGRTLMELKRYPESATLLAQSQAVYQGLGKNGTYGAARVALEQTRLQLAMAAAAPDCSAARQALSVFVQPDAEQAYAQTVLGVCLRAAGQAEAGNALIAQGRSALRERRSMDFPERRYAESVATD